MKEVTVSTRTTCGSHVLVASVNNSNRLEKVSKYQVRVNRNFVNCVKSLIHSAFFVIVPCSLSPLPPLSLVRVILAVKWVRARLTELIRRAVAPPRCFNTSVHVSRIIKPVRMMEWLMASALSSGAHLYSYLNVRVDVVFKKGRRWCILHIKQLLDVEEKQTRGGVRRRGRVAKNGTTYNGQRTTLWCPLFFPVCATESPTNWACNSRISKFPDADTDGWIPRPRRERTIWGWSYVTSFFPAKWRRRKSITATANDKF